MRLWSPASRARGTYCSPLRGDIPSKPRPSAGRVEGLVCFLLGWLSLEALYLRIAQLGDLRRHAGEFLVYAGVAFLVYLGLVAVVRQLTRSASRQPRWMLWGLLIGAVGFRVTLVGLTPTLSDDIHRYLWDGRVQLAGLNPYRYAPDDEALTSLRDASWALINHKDIPPIYPPLMQLAFRVGAWLSPTIPAQKWLFLTFDLALLLLLIACLPRWGIPPVMSVIYAWHPLVVIEVAASGHNDPLGVVCLMTGLWLWQARRRWLGTVSFALAFLAKFTTVLLWPFYWVRARKEGLVFLVALAAAGLWSRCSPHVTPGLGHYVRHWEFNGSLYPLLVALLGDPLLVRALSACVVMGAGWWMARRSEGRQGRAECRNRWGSGRSDDLVGYTMWMIQAMILLTPVLEPWYLLWLIPLFCVRFSWMWLVFSGSTLLSYTVLIRYVSAGIWQIPLWAKLVEYVPLYAWLLWHAWKRLSQTSDISKNRWLATCA